MSDTKSNPRHRGRGAGAEVRSGQDDHREGTRRPRPDRERFVPAHPYTVTEVETALATADAGQLVRALDRSVGTRDTACHCPDCGALRSVVALGRWHVRCEACGMLAAWLSLRQPVAASVECCVRLAALIHGRRSEVAA